MIKPAPTLSVVVPVHNAERTLANSVADLLEVLADLSARFEILIVDDGSTDQTEEVAHELAQQYPQVDVARHAERRGIEASAQTGAARTSGDVVIVHAGPSPVNTAELEKLWQTRDDEEVVVARCQTQPGTVSPDLLDRLAEWSRLLAEASSQSNPWLEPHPARRGTPSNSTVPVPRLKMPWADSPSLAQD